MKSFVIWLVTCFSLLAAAMFLRSQERKGWMLTLFLVSIIIGLVICARRRE